MMEAENAGREAEAELKWTTAQMRLKLSKLEVEIAIKVKQCFSLNGAVLTMKILKY